MGDLGIHNFAPVFSALKLTAPTSVQASSSPVFPDSYPMASMIHYEFPARGDLPTVKVHWYDGGLLPARPEEFEDERELSRENGVIFVGDKGKILAEDENAQHPRLLPGSLANDFPKPGKSIPRSTGHHRDWIAACKGGQPSGANFDYSGPLTENVLLGNLAIRAGKRLNWDGPNMKSTNVPEANDLVHCQYREGWTL
jgi:hypothetical protein